VSRWRWLLLVLLMCSPAVVQAEDTAPEAAEQETPPDDPPEEEPEQVEATPVPPEVDLTLGKRYRRGRALARLGTGTWLAGEGVFTVGVFFAAVGVLEVAFGGPGFYVDLANLTLRTGQVLCLAGPTLLVVGNRLAWHAANDQGVHTSFVVGWIGGGVVAATWAFGALTVAADGTLLGPAVFALASGTLGTIQTVIINAGHRRGMSEAHARWLPVVLPTLLEPTTPGLVLAWGGRRA